MGDSVVDRVHREVEAALRGPAAGASSLVVAVSGGPDSMALLHALLHLRCRLGLSLRGAHLDHGLRGDAGADDAAFVAGVFDAAEMPCDVEKADVAAYRTAHRLSLEQAAREVRYAFLARVYREHGADAIALGHTADDQAETILMHVVRGSGLTGLRGMEASSSRRVEGTEVRSVRPLLGITRADTEAYCRTLGLRPRMDESNRSPQFTRNRVRAELLPLLEELNPSVRDALLRLSTAATRELSYLDSEVDRLWDAAAEEGDGRVTLDRRAVRGLPEALRTHLLRRAVAAVKGDLEGVHMRHVDDMTRLLKAPRAGRSTCPEACDSTSATTRSSSRTRRRGAVPAAAPRRRASARRAWRDQRRELDGRRPAGRQSRSRRATGCRRRARRSLREPRRAVEPRSHQRRPRSPNPQARRPLSPARRSGQQEAEGLHGRREGAGGVEGPRPAARDAPGHCVGRRMAHRRVVPGDPRRPTGRRDQPAPRRLTAPPPVRPSQAGRSGPTPCRRRAPASSSTGPGGR